MEAARREAPAQSNAWPEQQDGHYGIPAVFNVPLGSTGHVHAYMHGKAEELQKEVDSGLRVSYDPSTNGTDTNPVVTDFLAELLHHPDPTAAKAATLTEDAVSRARNMLHLATRLSPYLAEAASTQLLPPATRYDHFLSDARGAVSYAAAVREAWGRLHAAHARHLGDADARVMERVAEAASGSQKELTAFL
eukprot:jgi/Tetstr1/430406/TSEL_020216.t1